MTSEREIVVRNEVGLHARPAAQFVKLANTFAADITVENLNSDGAPANAKSILSVLSAGVSQNHRIRLRAEGADAEEAVGALYALIERDFDTGEA